MSPLHKGFLKKRIARWLGVTRWDGAIRHLLMRDLTMLSVLPEGEAGNRALRDAFFAMIPVLRPTVFCDIGANDGTAALTVRELAPDCSVYGFEANPSIHAHYAAAMASRGVHWLNIAVSDTSGRLPVFAPRTLSRAYVDGQVVPAEIVEPEHTGKTSLLERAEEATYERFEVEARRLDDVFPRRRGERGERRFFLWIDVEGAADKVLRGAKAVLRDTLALFVEVENYRFSQGQKLASDICDLLYKNNFIPLARDREYADLQFNMLFVNTKVAPLLSSALFDSSSPLRACLASPSRFAASQSAEAPVASRADPAPTKRTYTCVRSFGNPKCPSTYHATTILRTRAEC